VLIQLLDILNTLFKSSVSYWQLTFITETFEPLVKRCAKFSLLLVNIQLSVAWSLEKLNF